MEGMETRQGRGRYLAPSFSPPIVSQEEATAAAEDGGDEEGFRREFCRGGVGSWGGMKMGAGPR